MFATLDLLGLTEFFAHPKVEFHPHKERMIADLLAELAAEGTVLRPDEVLFVDDNAAMLTRVRDGIGPVRVLQAGAEMHDLRDVLTLLDQRA